MSDTAPARYSDRTSDQCTVRYSRSQREEKGRHHTRRDHTTPHHTGSSRGTFRSWNRATSNVKRHLRNANLPDILTIGREISG